MTDTNEKLRGLFLATLMVMSVFAMTVGFAGSAAAVNRTINDGDTVFIGETDADMTGLPEFSGNTGANFVGVSGDAEGTSAFASDVTSVDVLSSNNWETGGYNADGSGDGETDFFVQEPSVNDVNVYLGSDTGGAEVTNGTVTSSQPAATIEALFNFDTSNDNAHVTVTDSDGLDVSNDALGTTPATDHTITASGGTVEVDVTNLESGTYTVTVTGDDDFDHISRSVTFTVATTDTTIDLSETDVTAGEDVIATVNGVPGENRAVRIAHADSVQGASPDQVFDNTGDVEGFDNGTENSVDYHNATLALGDDGQAQVRINTEFLVSEQTTTVEANEFADESPEDEVDLSVGARSVSIDSSPAAVPVGGEFAIEGTAAQLDEVSAYVKVDDTWYEIEGDDVGGEATGSGGAFVLNQTATDELAIPGSYRIGVVGYDSGDNPGTEIPNDEWGDEVAPTDSTSIQSIVGQLSANVSRTSIAASGSEEVTLSGVAVGQEDVEVYVLGPRGSVDTFPLSVDEQAFERDLSGFNLRGTYELIVVGDGRDNTFSDGSPDDVAPGTGGTNTKEQNREVILAHHDGPGVDDVVHSLNLSASAASLEIDPVGTEGQVLQEEIDVSGTSNQEPGTVVFVEVTTDDGTIVTSTQTEVGSDGTWSASLDLADAATGEYDLRAETGETTEVTTIEVVTSISTPTPPPTTAPPTTAPPTDTPEPTTAPPTDTPTPTEGDTGPGFGVVVALIALIAAALLAVRRKE